MPEKVSIIAVRMGKASGWRYVAEGGKVVEQRERAERMTSDDAGRRLLQYLNDYPGWTFQEEPADAAAV
jgi:hypothetical protein